MHSLVRTLGIGKNASTEVLTKDSSSMKVDPSLAATPMRWANNNNYVVSLGNNDRYEVNNWTFGN